MGEDDMSLSGSISIFGRGPNYSYTTSEPSEDWINPGFDSSSWSSGNAPFGDASGHNTYWNGRDLWMRKEFEVTGSMLGNRFLVAEIESRLSGATVYLNGRKVYTGTENTKNYKPCLIGPSEPILHVGTNTIAVHQDATYNGGRLQDVSLLTIPNNGAPVSLLGVVTTRSFGRIFDERSKKKWTDSYLALTHSFMRMNNPTFRAGALGNNDSYIVNWVSAASTPDIQTPDTVGARNSHLITMMESGTHGIGYNGATTGVTLSQDELNKLCIWIDLAVPFCKTYDEANAWSTSDKNWYNNRVQKREAMEAEEAENINELIQSLYGQN
jgi:hypothetical protein